MLAALATLTFAATLWLAVLLLARMLDESGQRIIAAAQAEALTGTPAPPSLRFNRALLAQAERPIQPRSTWRAAA